MTIIEAVMQVGDQVTITIPKENREWGYDPFPDGTKAVILGFSEIAYGRLDNLGVKPGVYVNRSWVILNSWEEGPLIQFSGRIELVDQKEYARRVALYRQHQQESPGDWRDKEFIRDLPETPFWEGDIVRVSSLDNRQLQIVSIDYVRLTEKTYYGATFPAYKVSDNLSAGWHTSASENEMVLVERGPVWKLSHDEPLTFGSLAEEARFYERIGHVEEVPNPKSGLYSWTKEEVLDAIRDGIVHGFSVSGSFLGTKPSICAKRFTDENLGKRVAQATLEGFALVRV